MFRLDMERVTKGVRVEMDANEDGSIQAATLAFMHNGANKRYAKRLDALMRPYRRKVALGIMDEARAEEILRKCFIETVLIGWENIPLPGAMPFSPEAAERVLSDPQNALFYDRLQQEAQIEDYYRLEEKETEAKN